jgi:hypothetical protein
MTYTINIKVSYACRIILTAEKDRGIGQPNAREIFDIEMKKKEPRKRAMSECGAPRSPPKMKQRRCSLKPKLDNWLGRRKSRQQAFHIVRKSSIKGEARSNNFLRRTSSLLIERCETIRQMSQITLQ